MERDISIHFYTSAGRGIQNMWIDTVDDCNNGQRYEVNSPADAGKALESFLDKLRKDDFERKRKIMCKEIPDCECCDIFGGHASCKTVIKNHFEEAEKIVNKWIAENRKETS